jgi:hypothetical protein
MYKNWAGVSRQEMETYQVCQPISTGCGSRHAPRRRAFNQPAGSGSIAAAPDAADVPDMTKQEATVARVALVLALAASVAGALVVGTTIG